MNTNVSFKSINIEGKTKPNIKAKILEFKDKASLIIEKVGMGYNLSVINGKTDNYFFMDVLVKSVDDGSKIIFKDTMNNNRPLHIKKIRRGGTVIVEGLNSFENSKKITPALATPNIIVGKIEDGGMLNTIQSSQALVVSNLKGGIINSHHNSSIDIMNNNGNVNLLPSQFESNQTVMVKNNHEGGTITVGKKESEGNKSNFVVRIFNHLGTLINNLSSDCCIDNLYPSSQINAHGAKSTIDIRNTSLIKDRNEYISNRINLSDGATLTEPTKKSFNIN